MRKNLVKHDSPWRIPFFFCLPLLLLLRMIEVWLRLFLSSIILLPYDDEEEEEEAAWGGEGEP